MCAILQGPSGNRLQILFFHYCQTYRHGSQGWWCLNQSFFPHKQ